MSVVPPLQVIEGEKPSQLESETVSELPFEGEVGSDTEKDDSLDLEQ